MMDFGYLSDTDNSAVEEIISQAQDLCVLEKVAAINCSSFTLSVLPTDLESRFRRLKSFPLAKPSSLSTCNTNPHAISPSHKKFTDEKEGEDFSDSKLNTSQNKCLNGKHEQTSVSPPSDPCLDDDAIFLPSIWSSKSSEHSSSISKPKSGSLNFPLGSPNSWQKSPSPARKSGCFWCSPRSTSKKKNKENRTLGSAIDWANNDDLLSDLSVLSKKEQQKILRKAMKEEEKFNREAEKIVNWAKQASARISFHGSADDL